MNLKCNFLAKIEFSLLRSTLGVLHCTFGLSGLRALLHTKSNIVPSTFCYMMCSYSCSCTLIPNILFIEDQAKSHLRWTNNYFRKMYFRNREGFNRSLNGRFFPIRESIVDKHASSNKPRYDNHNP